ncbi:BURP domain protein RD22-like, partial [Trifolium pratense]|uniref:BURP domain protein RD22-like n=1 Tax=Trifolium pratense TaxID=57577 RepID=UPI001E690FB6
KLFIYNNYADWMEDKSTNVNVGKGGVSVHTSKEKHKGTSVNVGKGGVNVHAGKGTNVNVGGGGGGVSVSAGHKRKEKPVTVTVGSYSPFAYRYAATETQIHDDHKTTLFFLENNLHPGTRMHLNFIKSSNEATFIPRQVADATPFSSDKLNDIFNEFSVEPESEEAHIMKNTIKECEDASIEGEEKYCATSLESMVDFSTLKLGKSVKVVSTVVEKKNIGLQKYTVKSGVKKLASGDKIVVCHKQNYPYAIFYCHKTENTRAYFVPLETDNGIRVKAVVVCHTNTSKWNPKHIAFQVLKIKPGTIPICHFLPEDHIVWVPCN